MSPIRLALMSVACCAALLAWPRAEATVIYRCTDAKGAVTMQNDVPCGPGMKQDVRRIGELPTAPAPAARPAAAPEPSGPPPGAQFELVRGPAEEALPDSAVPATERKPPPALFECTTWDNDVFVTDKSEPESRCATLNTTGLNGDPAFGAGMACEMKQDTCAALVDAPLCNAWRRRVDEAKFRMTYASDADKPARKADYERQLATFVDSTCR